MLHHLVSSSPAAHVPGCAAATAPVLSSGSPHARRRFRIFRTLRTHRPTHTTVVAYLSLFLALGGGAAYAAEELGGESIRDESLTGADVKNGSLGRGDLGTVVRSARQDSRNTCGRTAEYRNCVSVTVDLPRAQRLLMIASGEWESAAVNDAEGECRMRVDEKGAARGRRRFGELKSAPSSPFNLAMNAASGVPSGRHRVALSCRKTAGSMHPVRNADLSVVAVGDG